MSRVLIKQLAELKETRRASAVWREQTREKLLNLAQQSAPRHYTLMERWQNAWTSLRLTASPMPLASVLASLAIVLVGAVPFAQAMRASYPGNILYSVKRGAEHVELALTTKVEARGLLYIRFAELRLAELKSLPKNYKPGQERALLNYYSTNLAFAQASLEATAYSPKLAAQYDDLIDNLNLAIQNVPVSNTNVKPWQDAVAVTNTLNNITLVALVASPSGTNSQTIAARLTNKIATVEAKLQGVEGKLHTLPVSAARATPRVVIESKLSVVPAKVASAQAKQGLTEAKQLVEEKKFELALEKVQESETITDKTEAAVTQAEESDKAEAETPEEADAPVDQPTDKPSNGDNETKPDENAPASGEPEAVGNGSSVELEIKAKLGPGAKN